VATVAETRLGDVASRPSPAERLVLLAAAYALAFASPQAVMLPARVLAGSLAAVAVLAPARRPRVRARARLPRQP
jgi:hypothetical protein